MHWTYRYSSGSRLVGTTLGPQPGPKPLLLLPLKEQLKSVLNKRTCHTWNYIPIGYIDYWCYIFTVIAKHSDAVLYGLSKQPNEREPLASSCRHGLLSHVHGSKNLRETEKSRRKRSRELACIRYWAGHKRKSVRKRLKLDKLSPLKVPKAQCNWAIAKHETEVPSRLISLNWHHSGSKNCDIYMCT